MPSWQTAEPQKSGSTPCDRAAASTIRDGRPAEDPFSACRSSARPPIHIGAHARAQLRHLVERVGADCKCPQVEVAGGARGTPARVFALGGNQLDLDGDFPIAERGNADAKAVADLQRLDEVLAQI